MIFAICALLGLVQAWTARWEMNPDGISYLDIGAAYLRGDWKNAVNAYWSPLYSWILSLGTYLFRPSLPMEFPTAHFINWLIFLFGLIGFERVLRQIARLAPESINDSRPLARLFPSPWWALMHLLFLWGTLKLTALDHLTPDLLVGALIFWITAELVRMLHSGIDRTRAIVFGLLLGIGYLAKLHMLVLSAVYLLCGVLFVPAKKGSRSLWLLSAAAVLTVVLPFAAILSRHEQSITAGRAGQLNYAWWVDGVTRYAHWHPTTAQDGRPLHTTHQLLMNPPVYEYAHPIAGTYPVWFDPVYWMAGVQTHVRPARQLFILKETAAILVKVLTRAFPLTIVIGMLAFGILGGFKNSSVSRLQLVLIVPSAVGTAMFMMVHLEPRFIFSFLVLSFIAFLSMIQIPVQKMRLARHLMIAWVIVLSMELGTKLLPSLVEARIGPIQPLAVRSESDSAIANALYQNGILPGDPIAVLNNPFYDFWAHLARVRIVAEAQLTSPPDTRQIDAAMTALERTEAKAVLADRNSLGTPRARWQPLGSTGYFIYKSSAHHALNSPRSASE